MCGLNFTTKAFLDAHFKEQHGGRVMNERVHKCTQCASAFTRATNLYAHVRRAHEGYKGPHVCITCQTAFLTPSKLADHVRIHTTERPLKCDRCAGVFAASSQLRTHMCPAARPFVFGWFAVLDNQKRVHKQT
jgi:uncharacterized Zn-finger protein